MNQNRVPGNDPDDRRSRKRLAGPKVVLVGFLIIASITAFVLSRMMESTEPRPDPDSIPERPSGETGP